MFHKRILSRLKGATAKDVADAPAQRRADAHPDAPPRRPIRASEDLLGLFPSSAPPVLRAHELPADLDVPLAAFDPDAIPSVPLEPIRPVAPLVVHMPAEESFDLVPIARIASLGRTVEPVVAPSIASLLDRLESNAHRAVRPRRSLESTLGMLRALAVR